MLFKSPKVLTPLSRLTLLGLSVMALSGCASRPPQVSLTVPPTLREPCARADVGSLATVGDLGSLVIRQEASVSSCETKRAALVGLIDTYAEITRQRRWPWSK